MLPQFVLPARRGAGLVAPLAARPPLPCRDRPTTRAPHVRRADAPAISTVSENTPRRGARRLLCASDENALPPWATTSPIAEMLCCARRWSCAIKSDPEVVKESRRRPTTPSDELPRGDQSSTWSKLSKSEMTPTRRASRAYVEVPYFTTKSRKHVGGHHRHKKKPDGPDGARRPRRSKPPTRSRPTALDEDPPFPWPSR